LGGKYVSIYDVWPRKSVGVTRTMPLAAVTAPDACGAAQFIDPSPYPYARQPLTTLTPALLRHLVISLLHLDLFTPARAQVVK
jgi:hypothetical protein